MYSLVDFSPVFNQLKVILKTYATKLIVTTDSPNNYYLDGPYNEKYKRNIFFGSVQVKKNYVSYYLMPVYACPDLLDDISPELKKHMQGKSCFKFTKVEPELFKELANLTHKGFERFKKEKMLE